MVLCVDQGAPALTDAAEIAVPVHGRLQLEHRGTGRITVANRVAREVPCPVFVLAARLLAHAHMQQQALLRTVRLVSGFSAHYVRSMIQVLGLIFGEPRCQE